MTSFDLRAVKLRSGEEFRDEVAVAVAPLELGGQRYIAVPDEVPAELVVQRASTGTVFELRLTVRLHGPCVRCLTDAVLELPIHGTEYQATRPEGVEELVNAYLDDDRLDLSAWARDLVAVALPEKILCRPDCAGLCPTCGRDLNLEPHQHEEEFVDSRWSALAELRDEL